MNAKKGFVDDGSIVREIWGKSDIVLFIFAGAAAEFALNKAVDWLYFTGKLPADPLGRLFSTVAYAHRIIFASEEDAHKAIDSITTIHKAVEQQRERKIPDWAYRDVLFMLIHYSISAYELLERKLSPGQKDEVYDVFHRMGTRMGLNSLPKAYSEWLPQRELHMKADLAHSKYTSHLFAQYRKHLGTFRYAIMIQVQTMLLPDYVKKQLKLAGSKPGQFMIGTYKLSRMCKMDKRVKNILLPSAYRDQIAGLDKIL